MSPMHDDPMLDDEYDDLGEAARPPAPERFPLDRRQVTAFIVGAALVAAVAMGIGYRIGQANSPQAARILEQIEQARAEVRVTDIPNRFKIQDANAARAEEAKDDPTGATEPPAAPSPEETAEPALTFYKALPAAPTTAPRVKANAPLARSEAPAQTKGPSPRLEALAAARVADNAAPVAGRAAPNAESPTLYTVQVSSFRERNRADASVESLRAK
ncbi:MAG: hypothetical protein KC466_08095, partial [Myxococcales bacterium]|nr:hypothetical protein [Myxococcales bacterium]